MSYFITILLDQYIAHAKMRVFADPHPSESCRPCFPAKSTENRCEIRRKRILAPVQPTSVGRSHSRRTSAQFSNTYLTSMPRCGFHIHHISLSIRLSFCISHYSRPVRVLRLQHRDRSGPSAGNTGHGNQRYISVVSPCG